MNVVKRDGTHEPVKLDKVTERIANFTHGLSDVDPVVVSTKVVQSLKHGMKTCELDGISCEICSVLTLDNPHYGLLAGRIAKDNLRKQVLPTFSEAMMNLEAQLNKRFIEAVKAAGKEFDECVANATFDCTYRSFLCLHRSYLLKKDGKVAETPEMLFARVALCIHYPNMDKVTSTFSRFLKGDYIHATPTLFNAGTTSQQLSSCFLLSMHADSVEGIFNTLTKCALISKCSGGIGLDFTLVRAKGSKIHSTNGTCSGIVPALRIFNASSLWIDQSGKRNGAWAIYVEPWHRDIMDFLQLRLNTGHEKARARDLFYGLWMPDLFYHRVHQNKSFTLFCPTEAVYEGKSLHDMYGEEFEAAYVELEKQDKGTKMEAREIWDAILKACIETGAMYVMNKDAVNNRNPQKNLGAIRCSNLCTEVVLFTSPNEIAVCNLATLSLPRFVKTKPDDIEITVANVHDYFDYEAFMACTRELVVNLDKVIDINVYPVPEAEESNKRNRPIGLGVQGLGDVFHMLMLPPTGPEARVLNRRIFEAMYFAAVSQSVELARVLGPYPSFPGSPASQGLLQFDMWTHGPVPLHFAWDELKARVKSVGMRNSTLISPPPTVSTSAILGNSECIEVPPNFVLSKTLSGEFATINHNLVKALQQIGKWNQEVRDSILKSNGSIQQLDVPQNLKSIFKTTWEVSLSESLEMNAERAPFIDQSISFNLYVAQPEMLTSALFKSWSLGLKGTYYTRTRAAASPIDFSCTPTSCVACTA